MAAFVSTSPLAWDFSAAIILVFSANELILIQQIHSSCILIGKNTEHHRSSKTSRSFIQIAKGVTSPEWSGSISNEKESSENLLWPSLGKGGNRRGTALKEDVGASTYIWKESCYQGLPIQAICPKTDGWWSCQSIQNLMESMHQPTSLILYYNTIKWWSLEELIWFSIYWVFTIIAGVI